MNALLIKLKQKIDAFEKQIEGMHFSPINHALFDQHLFDSPKREHHVSFYLDKIKFTYQTLSTSITSNDLEKINFFSELLVNQISALTRELSTHHLRTNNPKVIFESLSEKHSRHLDYLRRLNAMRCELERSSDSLNYQKIATLDNRIYRCQQAIKQIEIQLENDNQNSS